MYQINLQKPCTAYFIGIGGISMSGFAQLLHENGFTVKGSDSQESKITKHLASLGIDIIYVEGRVECPDGGVQAGSSRT